MKIFKNSFAIFFLLLVCCASLTWAQASHDFGSFLKSDPLLLSCPGANQNKPDNEYVYSGQPSGNFYCNPLVLDGVAFDYNTFSLESKGELKLTKGDPKTGKTVDVPFYLHLRRNGMFVIVYTVEGVIFSKADISVILGGAQNGDELIIEPVNKEDWPAKRIVSLGNRC